MGCSGRPASEDAIDRKGVEIVEYFFALDGFLKGRDQDDPAPMQLSWRRGRCNQPSAADFGFDTMNTGATHASMAFSPILLGCGTSRRHHG
jgi:hypothetical protein